MANLRSNDKRITCVKFLADGNRLLSSGLDSTFRLWDVRRAALINKLAIIADRHDADGNIIKAVNSIHSFTMSPDESRAYVASDGTVRVIEIGRWTEVSAIGCLSETYPPDIAISPDGKTLALTDFDEKGGCIRLIDTNSFQEVRRLATQIWGSKINSEQSLVAFSHDGTLLASSVQSGDPEEMSGWLIWNLADGRIIHKLPLQVPRIFGRGDVGTPSFSKDGSRLLTASNFGSMIWSTSNGQLLARSLRGDSYIANWSPNEKWIATQGFPGIGTLKDAATLKESTRFGGPGDWGPGAISICQCFSPNSHLLAVGGYDGNIAVWKILE